MKKSDRIARELEHTVVNGVENAKDWATPRVEAAVNWAVPRIQHGIDTASPKLQEGLKSAAYNLADGVATVTPKLQEGLANLAPKIHDVVEDASPKIQEALNKATPRSATRGTKLLRSTCPSFRSSSGKPPWLCTRPSRMHPRRWTQSPRNWWIREWFTICRSKHKPQGPS
ncbi:hypothetical protein AHiyo1_28570 [Arthrobacter sp. Hiyo1]|nr:hypothetical protein AHiyo1_28570 [Arthrobacter sp. Hiyo1]